MFMLVRRLGIGINMDYEGTIRRVVGTINSNKTIKFIEIVLTIIAARSYY